MAVYHIYEARPAADGTPEIRVLADQFNWLAFLFPLIWALWYRLWWYALGYIAVVAGSGWLFELLFNAPEPATIVLVAVHFFFGLNGALWRAQALERQNFQPSDLRVGPSLAAVEADLFSDAWLAGYYTRWSTPKSQQTGSWNRRGVTQPMATMFEGAP